MQSILAGLSAALFLAVRLIDTVRAIGVVYCSAPTPASAALPTAVGSLKRSPVSSASNVLGVDDNHVVAIHGVAVEVVTPSAQAPHIEEGESVTTARLNENLAIAFLQPKIRARQAFRPEKMASRPENLLDD